MPSIQEGLHDSHTVAGTRTVFEEVRDWIPPDVAGWLADSLEEPQPPGISIPR